jgi:hypothetical protein
MGCGCKGKKQEPTVQPPVSIRLSEVQTPEVTQPITQEETPNTNQ